MNLDTLNRRRWLRRLPVPMLATSYGSGFLEADPSAYQAASSPTGANDRGTRIFNIRDLGANGDGTTLDTRALQAAIDACNADGGGTVVVPEGTFQIGTVELKSNVTLYVAASAKLLGSADGKQYHALDAIPLKGDSTLDGNWALLFAVDAKNVTVEGPGLWRHGPSGQNKRIVNLWCG